MPHWMESMASEVPEEEMGELKIILRYFKTSSNCMNAMHFNSTKKLNQFNAAK